METIFNKKLLVYLGILAAVEILSFFAFIFPAFNPIFFFLIIIAVFILSVKNLEYGVLIVLAELFIGSKGYLFSCDFFGRPISIRIAIWSIVMLVWFGALVYNIIKNKDYLKYLKKEFFSFRYFIYFSILFILIFWGLLNGILNKNDPNNIFFDFNGWIYFLFILPLLQTVKDKKNIINIFQVFFACVIWISIKTLFLLYAFSHNLLGINSIIYKWVRITGVGEITAMQNGFYRIFFQVHIFVIIGIILILSFLIFNRNSKKRIIFYLVLLTLFSSINIVSFSRSNWVGYAVGCLIFFVIIFWQTNWKKSFLYILCIITSTILSIGLVYIIIKFPIPLSSGSFSADFISDRALNIENESAVSSRWSELPVLRKEILKNIIVGQGFGTTITYQSSDPRNLQNDPKGMYTTYAFEWGWLDIWLKIGALGLFCYLIILCSIVINGFNLFKNFSDEEKIISISLIMGLIIISIINFFSPYLNHPIGIGFLLISAVIINLLIKNNNRSKNI